MIAQCPDCKTKMNVKPPTGTRAGQKAAIKCRCGTRLRFEMPRELRKPVGSFEDVMADLRRQVGL